MDQFVVLATTMRRILKHYSRLGRIERAATLVACEAADNWIHSVVGSAISLAEETHEKTISAETMVAALGENELFDAVPRVWSFSKTRLRDRIKWQAGELRISLAAKVVLYNAFEDYLTLLGLRIAISQDLAARRTISHRHVIAAINAR